MNKLKKELFGPSKNFSFANPNNLKTSKIFKPEKIVCL